MRLKIWGATIQEQNSDLWIKWCLTLLVCWNFESFPGNFLQFFFHSTLFYYSHLIKWFGVSNMHTTDWNHILWQWHWNIKRWICINKSNYCLLFQFRYRRTIGTEFFLLDFIDLRIKHGCTMTTNDKNKEIVDQNKTRNHPAQLRLTSIQWCELKSSKIVAKYSYHDHNANSNVEHMNSVDGRQ